jgi:hypothetical protein
MTDDRLRMTNTGCVLPYRLTPTCHLSFVIGHFIRAPAAAGRESELLQIFGQNTGLLPRTEDVGLSDHFRWVFLESVTMTIGASGDPTGDNGIATFTNLIKLGFLSNLRCFGGSLGQ